MYNLPYQESEDPLDDINCCFGTGINCIDLYHLNIFPGTRMYKWMHEKELLSKYYSITRQNDFYQAYQQLINDSCQTRFLSGKKGLFYLMYISLSPET